MKLYELFSTYSDTIYALDMDIDILTHAHENQPSQKASLSQLLGKLIGFSSALKYSTTTS